MRRISVALAAVAVALVPAAVPAAPLRLVRSHGILARLPEGWHAAPVRFTDCLDPVERLALTTGRRAVVAGNRTAGDAAVILVLENVSMDASGVPPRRVFRLPRLGLMGGCCGMPIGRGFELVFRDHGRRLYAFVYGTRRPLLEQALAIVNGLDVAPSR